MKLSRHSVMRRGLSGALLALGSLAIASCGDDDPAPADARRPPDANQAADASRPVDANRPVDGGVDPVPIDAAPVDAAAFFCGSLPDKFEPNDSAVAPRTLAPSYVSDNPETINGSWWISACRDGSNEDWYLLSASQIRFDLATDFDGVALMQLILTIEDTGICAGIEECGQPLLPEAPENTVTVSVYRASNMELVTTTTDLRGVAYFFSDSEHYTEDVLVSVTAPPEALYDYRLSINISIGLTEDECEC